MFLKISQTSQAPLFNKVVVLRACNFVKETPTQMLSCEICEIFKNSYFEEHLWTTASKLILKGTQTQMFSCEFCELFENTYFKGQLWTAEKNKNTGEEVSLW